VVGDVRCRDGDDEEQAAYVAALEQGGHERGALACYAEVVCYEVEDLVAVVQVGDCDTRCLHMNSVCWRCSCNALELRTAASLHCANRGRPIRAR
jgi:hypothetical protein